MGIWRVRIRGVRTGLRGRVVSWRVASWELGCDKVGSLQGAKFIAIVDAG